MKTGKSIVELAQELTRQKEAKKDFVADTRQLSMTDDADMDIEGFGAMPLTEHAHRQVGQKVDIPAKYYDKMRSEAPHLLAENVNHWFTEKPERRMVRTLDGQVRAMLSESYRPLDNFDLAEAVLPKIAEMGCEVMSSEITATRMYLKCVTSRITAEVAKGDIVQAGIIVSNSEVGAGSLRVEPLVYRLVCLNGMIANDYAMRKNHVGRKYVVNEANPSAEVFFRDETRQADDKAFFLKVQDTVAATMDEVKFRTIVGKMHESTERKIEIDPVKMVEQVSKTFSLNEGEQAGFLGNLISGGMLTQYGVGNALTRMAQDVESYDRSIELERAGGDVILLPQNSWKAMNKAS